MGVIVQNIIKCYFPLFSPLDPARLHQLVNSWRENQLFWKISILKLTSRSRWCSLYIPGSLAICTDMYIATKLFILRDIFFKRVELFLLLKICIFFANDLHC